MFATALLVLATKVIAPAWLILLLDTKLMLVPFAPVMAPV